MQKFVLLSTALLGIAPFFSLRAESALRDFITVRGDQLMEGDKPFRFISFNLPNLQMIEDNLPFAETNPWRLPDEFEIRDGLATVRQMGGTVVRTYVLSVRRTNDTPGMPRHVVGPGQFNEAAFREFDLALKIANEQSIRLIIPLVDNWAWQGGRAEYAGFRGKPKEAFWTDPQIIDDFKKTIRFVLLRTNTLTGIRYGDDKAILCWETGNEIFSPPSWTHDIAGYIKSLDTHHLVMDGVAAFGLKNESLTDTNVDIVTTHHYPNARIRKTFAESIRENWAKAKGKKPYVVGEFGFVSTADMEDALNAIMDTGMSGGLLWSLRFHNRDGGFYWHSEPSGGNRYKGLHWPGSPIGAAYDEINLMAMVRRYAFAIRGLVPPPIPPPAPPGLLPITDAAAISWQGSLGAASYIVEHAPKASGPWTVVADGVDESFVQYRPLFVDESAPAGNWYYRVRARNDSGVSEPSIVFGPVKVTHATFVDELADFSRVHARTGDWEIKTRESRRVKEDAHRAAGMAGDTLVYQLAAAIESFRVYVFFPGDNADLRFAVSADGQEYHDVTAARKVYFGGPGDYKYWKPVLYEAERIGSGGKYLKIELGGETQIGRVEITHAIGEQHENQ
jgi:hypothetical protein